jgi:hypothetical protein
MRTRTPPVVALLLAALLAGCSGEAGEPPEAGPGQGTLRGVVVTAAIVPIAGATVTAEPGGLEATTDESGEFTLGPLEPGAYGLQVRAQGYAPQRLAAQVVEGEGELLHVVLAAVASDVPYSELLHYEAFIECSYAQNIGGVVGGDFSCFGLSDLVLQVEIDNDVNTFPLHVNAGGFKGLLFEMVWEPQSTMPEFAGYIRSPVAVGEAGGLGLEHQYWANSSANPMREWVLQGVENNLAYDGDVFHPDPAAAGEYEILVGGVTSGDQPAEAAFALNQYLDLFVTTFYNALGGDAYSAIAPQ